MGESDAAVAHVRAIIVVIPTALRIERCPGSDCDGSDLGDVGNERVPGAAAGTDDLVVAVPNGDVEEVAADLCPHVLDRVQLGRIARERQEGDIGRDHEASAGSVPACAVA